VTLQIAEEELQSPLVVPLGEDRGKPNRRLEGEARNALAVRP
jgi:hypothetical protein